MDASAHWQTHHAQILKGTVSSKASAILHFVHVERDVRLLVHGDDFMVQIPTHEEKQFESVLFWDTMESARRSSIRMAPS